MKILLCFWLTITGLNFAIAQCDNVEISSIESNKPSVTINNPDLNNISSLDYNKNFGIYRLRNKKQSRISVSCRYELNTMGQLVFTPISKLANDLEFVIQTVVGKDTCWTIFNSPKTELLSNLKRNIGFEMFPKTDIIPLNILCFHIHFEEAMNPIKDAFRYIEVFDENNAKISTMWRNRTYWLKDNTIMVLMVHPARVKRGIDLDIPFLEGKEYVIKLKDGLISQSGIKIPSQDIRKYRAIKPDYSVPKFTKFDMQLPIKNGFNTLRFSFNEGMDYSSVQDGIVLMLGNKKIEGRINMLENDSVFEFIPNNKWRSGTYDLVLQKKVSDFSSNRLNSPFEEKLDGEYPNKDISVIKMFTVE